MQGEKGQAFVVGGRAHRRRGQRPRPRPPLGACACGPQQGGWAAGRQRCLQVGWASGGACQVQAQGSNDSSALMRLFWYRLTRPLPRQQGQVVPSYACMWFSYDTCTQGWGWRKGGVSTATGQLPPTKGRVAGHGSCAWPQPAPQNCGHPITIMHPAPSCQPQQQSRGSLRQDLRDSTARL